MIKEKKYQDKEWLGTQYIDGNRKVIDIARECQVNRKTINHWLRKFGFPKRKESGGHNNRTSGEEHPNWKGNDVGYYSLHNWIRKYKSKPENCENCGKKQAYLELANISGKYKRDIKDYKYLCVRCHKIMDGNLRKFIKGGEKTRFKKGHKNELRYNRGGGATLKSVL